MVRNAPKSGPPADNDGEKDEGPGKVDLRFRASRASGLGHLDGRPNREDVIGYRTGKRRRRGEGGRTPRTHPRGCSGLIFISPLPPLEWRVEKGKRKRKRIDTGPGVPKGNAGDVAGIGLPGPRPFGE